MHKSEIEPHQAKSISTTKLKSPSSLYPVKFVLLLQTLMILARVPMNSAFALVHRGNSKYGQIVRGGRLFKTLPNVHSGAFANTIQTLIQRTSSQTSLSSGNIKSDDINFEASGFSFEFDSFDKKGEWLKIDWNEKPNPSIPPGKSYNIFQPDSDVRIGCYSPDEPSPVQLSLICDRMVYVKRDDLLYLHNSNVSGNKARKLLALNELKMKDFPDAIVSYGGPQSNAMLALAAIVNSRNVELAKLEDDSDDLGVTSDIKDEIENDGWFHGDDDNDVDDADDNGEEDDNIIEFESKLPVLPEERKKRFVYYTKKLPRYLRKQPSGNLLRALTLGMELVQVSNDDYNNMFGGEDGGSASAPSEIEPPIPMKSIWIPQGGFCGVATQGATLLADEIVSFWAEKGNGMPLTVCLPGGTCTTAMLLCREINALTKKRDGVEGSQNVDIKVAVIPCVGDEAYARRQMKALDESTGGNCLDDIPDVFKPWTNRYPRFGEPSLPLLGTFMEMKDTHSLYVDLLYGAPAWNLLLKYLTSQRDSPIKDRQVMYVHSGGLEGISSQLTRYKHKGFLEDDQIQK